MADSQDNTNNSTRQKSVQDELHIRIRELEKENQQLRLASIDVIKTFLNQMQSSLDGWRSEVKEAEDMLLEEDS